MSILKLLKKMNKKSQMLAWDELGKYILGVIIILVVILIIGIISSVMMGNTNLAFDIFNW